jgi:hypothetical protein
MIAKIVHAHICLREETLSFNMFVYLVLLKCTTVSIVGTHMLYEFAILVMKR